MKKRKIRYGVVGLGHIAQKAVLPAFGHAKENSELVALFSGDAEKLAELGEEYGVSIRCTYEEYESCLASGQIDAVYIALPNHLHHEFTVKAARNRVHVLCEKPLALTEDECQAMIDVCASNEVKLMTAYRLHFERATLEAIEIVNSGDIGDPKLFSSQFTMQVSGGNVRVNPRALGGGPLYDLGIYCINAARNLFRAEPVEAAGFSGEGREERFRDVEENVTAVLRFPGDRLAQFTCGFGSADTSSYRIVGTRGDLFVDPAYEYDGALEHRLTVEGKSKRRRFGARDQFAPEIVYFSSCILEGKDPEPSGEEGLADVRAIRAIYQSIDHKEAVPLAPFEKALRPSMEQELRKPRARAREMVRVQSPHPE